MQRRGTVVVNLAGVKNINRARLSKLKHKNSVKDKVAWKKMEANFGKTTNIDNEVNLEKWKQLKKEEEIKDVNDIRYFSNATVDVNTFVDDSLDDNHFSHKDVKPMNPVKESLFSKVLSKLGIK